ncbi:MAG: ring-cleaving dioxygenase [Nitrososphaeraceae archaeon]|nr:ring-cleaving dioxygenase [Nitrososphaeraceae archaeon]MDW0198296.1 ring-cleaving dioxygenase [Nitrososphaeraceae archaeon]MDW0267620.1 ring-cleaving dioxygenase [Nitrososphaeraceae archaeon]
MSDIFGIHHVTAIAGHPQRNVNFYTSILGLRLVKLTVNFDDPTTYHLYFGDELGRPGTILTFFPWSDAPKGHRGTGQVVTTSFLIPKNSIDYWKNRLKNNDVTVKGPFNRFDEQVLTVYDSDGLELELVAHSSAEDRDLNVRNDGGVPFEYAVRGFYSVALSEEGFERTAGILEEELGFSLIGQEKSRFRYKIKNSETGASIVDVLCLPYTPSGYIGKGSVHHVAFRTPTDEKQKVLRSSIIKAGLNATPVIDRTYFHSVYFREPGGILFEIATDPPGFTIDQKPSELGTRLMLPEWLESERKNLEKILPRLSLPYPSTQSGVRKNNE